MLKKLILLILLIGIAGSAFAAIDYTDPKQPFMPYYWLKGRVQLPQGIVGSVKDRVVYFYRDDIHKAIKVKTNDAGVFQINVWDLYYYDKDGLQITFGPQAYHVAVENNPLDDYGLDPIMQALTFQMGYTTVLLTLAKGEGPIGFHIVNDALLPDATKGKAYEQFIEAAGGITPYAWSYVGSLPAGMKLEKDGDKFKLSGTPTEIGIFTFTVTVTDANGETAQKIFTLNVKETVVPQVTDDGPVILTIVREVNNIRVKWTFNPAYKLPPETLIDLYVLPGKGEGSFTNNYALLPNGSYNWTKVLSADMPQGNPVPPSWQITLSDAEVLKYLANGNVNEFLAIDQAGIDGAVKELYFKALPSDAINWPVIDKLPKVMSVGKNDYNFGQGNNYFNCSFLTTGTLSDVIGTTGIAMNCQVLDHDRTTDGFNASTFNGTSWENPYALALSKGYVFFSSSNLPFTLTLVGRVNPDPSLVNKALEVGNTFIGLPFPLKKKLSDLFGANPIMNDSVLIHDKTTDGFTALSCVNDGSFTEPDFELKPTVGYVYYRSSGQFNWQPLP